jgi:hypothetical protein
MRRPIWVSSSASWVGADAWAALSQQAWPVLPWQPREALLRGRKLAARLRRRPRRREQRPERRGALWWSLLISWRPPLENTT